MGVGDRLPWGAGGGGGGQGRGGTGGGGTMLMNTGLHDIGLCDWADNGSTNAAHRPMGCLSGPQTVSTGDRISFCGRARGM